MVSDPAPSTTTTPIQALRGLRQSGQPTGAAQCGRPAYPGAAHGWGSGARDNQVCDGLGEGPALEAPHPGSQESHRAENMSRRDNAELVRLEQVVTIKEGVARIR